MSADGLSALVLLPEYREQRQRFFLSEGSLQWYVRSNKAGLVACRALLMHAGRWWVDADKFDAYIIEAGAAAAQAQSVPA